MIRWLVAGAAGLIACVAVSAARGVAAPGGGAGGPVPVVVELFTSEGCSSCPPADALLQELLAKQPVPGATVIGLSEHVDYWNQLGWRDPFSSASFSERQQHYSQTTSAEVYTPQMIVDGTAAFVGSDRTDALNHITQATARPHAPVTITWAAPSQLDVTIPRATAGDDVVLAIVEDGLSSAVKSGENAGRTMTHAAVTRRLESIGAIDNNGRYHVSMKVTVAPNWRTAALSAVVFLQTHGQRAIEGAAALHFPK